MPGDPHGGGLSHSFLTAKTLESDLMYGLGLGADDYIMKPFGIGALRARINAHLRRENREKRNILYMDPVRFNLSGKELYAREDKVPLTKSEYEICEFLARHRGQVFSKENIYEGVFGYDGRVTAVPLRSMSRTSAPSWAGTGLRPLKPSGGSDISGSCKTTQNRAAAHLFSALPAAVEPRYRSAAGSIGWRIHTGVRPGALLPANYDEKEIAQFKQQLAAGGADKSPWSRAGWSTPYSPWTGSRWPAI